MTAADQPSQPQPATAPPTPVFGDVVEARAGTYYRNTRYLMCVMCIAAGAWFGYDGWVGWPESNRRHEDATVNLERARQANDTAEIKKWSDEQAKFKLHGGYDIPTQKVLACTLPPLGVLLLAWSIHRSRGAYRLAGQTLSIPGHPDIQLDDITRIDKQKWDRKGIVDLYYTTPAGQSGVIVLDNFIYNRPPTDEIFRRIENYLVPAAESGAATE